MARATAHPDHRCISSEDIHGTTIYGADGRNIGEIGHLIIDKLSGRVAYRRGGLWGARWARDG
jgi:PRC-barrel domain